MGPETFKTIEELKALRVQIDAAIQVCTERAKDETYPTDANLYYTSAHQVEIKLREAKMWVGKMMEAKGSELPPEFRDQAPKL